MKQPRVVFVPGLRDRMPEHWQERLSEQLPGSTLVPPLTEDKLNLAARVEALDRTVQAAAGPVLLVAHSAGNVIVAHWAARHRRALAGALLVAPIDIESPLPAGAPTMEQLRAQGWLPVPREPFAFPSTVAASANDPLGPPDRIAELARAWGSRLVQLGPVGHLVPASGHGDWPEGLRLIQSLLTQQEEVQ